MYDLAIIGGGPAGYSAALEGVKLGLSIVLFEESQLGGTCLNRGCVPTKFLAHIGEVYARSKNSEDYGIVCENVNLDYEKVYEKKEQVVSQLRDDLEKLLLNNKITIVIGSAQMLDCQNIKCDNTIYQAKNILIATGSNSQKPFVEGAITSDQLLKLKEVPKSIKIIGGGVVAVEFAHIFNLLSSEVILSIRGERILRKWDKEIAIGLTQNLKKRGIVIRTKCSIEQMQQKETEIILSAVGRVPNLKGIELSLVELDKSGAIIVSEHFQTKVPNVYAVGDVISNSPMLAHTAMEQGKIVANIIAGKPEKQEASIINCIYTEPEIASVGLTESQAKEKGIAIISAKQNLRSNARTLISSNARNFIKIIADAQSYQILGAQLMCERASDIVAELALAIDNKMTIDEINKSVRPHPSFCEAVTDVVEALLEKIHEI